MDLRAERNERVGDRPSVASHDGQLAHERHFEQLLDSQTQAGLRELESGAQ